MVMMTIMDHTKLHNKAPFFNPILLPLLVKENRAAEKREEGEKSGGQGNNWSWGIGEEVNDGYDELYGQQVSNKLTRIVRWQKLKDHCHYLVHRYTVCKLLWYCNLLLFFFWLSNITVDFYQDFNKCNIEKYASEVTLITYFRKLMIELDNNNINNKRTSSTLYIVVTCCWCSDEIQCKQNKP